MKYKLLFIILFFASNLFAQNKNQSIGFKENKGQIIDQKGKPNPDVKYLLNTNGLNVQIKTTGFSYDIYETKKHPITEKQKAILQPSSLSDKDKKNSPNYTLEYIYHRIDIDFVNSNPKVELINEQKSKDYDNYYNVPNKPDGVLMVHQYQQITYKNIYPNIDVVFSIPKDSLKPVEYNFVVHPKGKISDIQLKFNGAKTELVDNKIRMQVRFGDLEETLPMSWTEDGKTKKEIAVGYTKIKKNVYGFASAENVSGKTVVIDPVPTRLWGTFYGDQTNIAYSLGAVSVTTDSSGNSYMTGTTSASNSSYATTGAYQTSIPPYTYGSFNGIIVKFSPNGNRLWGSYYGGEDYNAISGIKIDTQNNILITGITKSPINISTIGAYKPNLSGVSDTFLVKFNESGVRIWGTYFGGENDDSAYSLEIDKNDNIYMVGSTTSKTNIAFHSSFQTQLNLGTLSNLDGFLTKFDKGGNLIWSTYVGGEGRDDMRTIVVKDNYLIIGGFSSSINNISTSGVFQEIYNSTNSRFDGVVYKFSLDGQRKWGTYYGGEGDDFVLAVEADDLGNIYLGGKTSSNTNITTPNSFDSTNPYSEKGFFSKLNSNGQRIWGTYLGEAIVYSLIFKNNSIYTGATNSLTYNTKLTSLCSYKPDGYFDGYIGKFSNQGGLIWGTFVGGRILEGGDNTMPSIKIAFDNNNSIFVGGISRQNDGIANSSSYQPSILGFPRSNYFLMKFSEDIISSPIISSNSPICIGKSLELKASGGTNYLWIGPNGFKSTEQNPTIINATANNRGEYSCLITGTGGCDDTKTVDVFVGDTEQPIPTLTALPTIIGDCTTQITTIPTATDACAGVITATTASPLSYSLPGTYTIVWKYDDGNGNSITQNQTVTISNQPLPTATSPKTFCIQQNATLSSITITGQNIKWYDAMANGNLLANTTLLQNGITYYASQTINGCESERTPVLINIQNTLAPTGDSNQSFCTSQNPTIANLIVSGNSIKWYDSLNYGSLLTQTTNLVNGKTYYASQTTATCESERFGVSISIVNTPSAPTANTNQSFCKKENATLNTIQIAGQNIKWYDTNSATATLPNTTLLENNKTYYASQTIGCESDRTPVLVQVYDTPLPTGNTNQQFCKDENATLSNFNMAGSNIKWYDESTNGTVLAATTLLQNGKTYYATQTLNDCESERVAVFVKVQDTPIPIANSPQTFCVQKNAKISDIVIEGQNITWFENASSTLNLSESTLLENGITYYASQTINNCESDRIPVSIIILEATSEDCINFVDELPYPKFFTPNNDGYNDTWTIDFAYLSPNTGIKIFDRYGKLIKTLVTNNDSWNGTFNGTELPSTDYWFVVTRANGLEYKGHFSLKR